MAKNERRNAIALDDAYLYCRKLQEKTETPSLFKVCNAISTLDLALNAQDESPIPMTLTAEAWSHVRDTLFDVLVSSFSGYFIVYSPDSPPLEAGMHWPDSGFVEFYPDRSNRKNDSYTGRIENLNTDVHTTLRWIFAEGRQQISPSDFSETETKPEVEVDDAERAARELLFKLYEVCEEQACEGKKKAHRKWWQLYWEANSCPNKRQKHELEKQMSALQSIWGTPAD